MNEKKWRKEEIREMLEMNDKAVVRGLVRIYEKQTDDEKKTEMTTHENGVGFNGSDSRFLSKLACFYIKHGYLSEKQLSIVRKRILKYAGQLTKIANKEL